MIMLSEALSSGFCSIKILVLNTTFFSIQIPPRLTLCNTAQLGESGHHLATLKPNNKEKKKSQFSAITCNKTPKILVRV